MSITDRVGLEMQVRVRVRGRGRVRVIDWVSLRIYEYHG
jgi:hypothetical protein